MADQSLLNYLAAERQVRPGDPWNRGTGPVNYFINTGGAWRRVPAEEVEAMFGNGIASKLQPRPQGQGAGGEVSLQQGIKQLHDAQFNSLASSGWLDKFAVTTGTSTADVAQYFQSELAQGKSFQDIVNNNPYIDAQGNSKVAPNLSYVPPETTDVNARPLALRPQTESVGQPTGQTQTQDPAKEVQDTIQQYIDKKAEQGMMINPNIQIDENILQKFLKQAETELGPVYAQKFKQVQQDLQKAGRRVAESYSKDVRNIGLKYGQNLEAAQQAYANRGLEFSSAREKTEQDLARSATEDIQSATQKALETAQDTGTEAERLLGSTNLPPLSEASIGTGYAPITGKAGQYGLTSATGSRQLFSPEGNTFGSLEQSKLADVTGRQKELTANERELRSLNYL